MDKAEYHNELQSVFLLTAITRNLKLSDLLRAMEHAEAAGPIINPALYIRAATNLDWQKRLVQATLRFQREIEKIASKQPSSSLWPPPPSPRP